MTEPTKEFLEAFGVKEAASETPPQTEETSEDTSGAQSETPDSQTEPTTETAAPETETPDDSAVKMNQAFAQLRTQNKQYSKLVQGIASLLGVQDSDPDKLTTALQQKLIESQAKQQNIDPQILQRLQQLEEKEQMFDQEETRRIAFLGFQKVKDTFGLDDKGLQKFASELVADGLNPFEQKLDLHGLYIQRNYSKLVADAEARGAQREAERAAKATTHSSTPSTKSGQTPETPAKISTIQDLNAWINKHGSAE
jgi:hypothetical protein